MGLLRFATSRYTTRKTQHGQTDVIRTENAHLPHVYVSWWDGCGRQRAIVPASQADSYRANEEHRTVRPAVWVD